MDKATVAIICDGENGLIDFLHTHGFVTKTKNWNIPCPVMKLTDKSQDWIQDKINYLGPTSKFFQFDKKDNEIIYGLRFYFPIEIYTDDELKKQDKFLVLELMEGNNGCLFFAYYDFDKKKYYPTNIKFQEKHIFLSVKTKQDNKSILSESNVFYLPGANGNLFTNRTSFHEINNSYPEKKYDEERPVVFEDVNSIRCAFLRFVKRNWRQCIVAAFFGIVFGLALAKIYAWPCCFFGVVVFACWMLCLWEPGVTHFNDVSVNSVPLHLNRKPPSLQPQPQIEDRLKHEINTGNKVNEEEKCVETPQIQNGINEFENIGIDNTNTEI